MADQSIVIYTDGACSGNPGPGGWGVLIIKDGLHYEYGGREDHTTNNIMELTAAIEALAELGEEERPVRLYTDSEYLKKGITQWIHLWKVNNWRKSDKSEVKNVELWRELDDLNHPHIRWEWVKGHADNPYNCRVDKIARSFAEGNPIPLARGEKPGSDFAEKNSDCVTEKPVVNDKQFDIPVKRRTGAGVLKESPRSKTQEPPVSEIPYKEVEPEPDITMGASYEEDTYPGDIEENIETTLYICKPFIEKFAETLKKKGFEPEEVKSPDFKYSFVNSNEDMTVDISASGAFLIDGYGPAADRLSVLIREADNRYLEKFVQGSPLEIPDDIAAWKKEHFRVFLRPFYKGMVHKWKFKFEKNTLLAHDPQNPDIHFEITTGNEPAWKSLPPASVYAALKKSAEAAITFEDRIVMGTGERADGSVILVLAPLNRQVLNMARARVWQEIAGEYSQMSSDERLRIQQQLWKYILPLTINTVSFAVKPGSEKAVSDEARYKRLDTMLSEYVKIFAAQIPGAFERFPLDLILGIDENTEKDPLQQHLAKTRLHEKVTSRYAQGSLETAALRMIRFIAREIFV